MPHNHMVHIRTLHPPCTKGAIHVAWLASGHMFTLALIFAESQVSINKEEGQCDNNDTSY